MKRWHLIGVRKSLIKIYVKMVWNNYRHIYLAMTDGPLVWDSGGTLTGEKKLLLLPSFLKKNLNYSDHIFHLSLAYFILYNFVIWFFSKKIPFYLVKQVEGILSKSSKKNLKTEIFLAQFVKESIICLIERTLMVFLWLF
jgi:hypothetical protein